MHEDTDRRHGRGRRDSTRVVEPIGRSLEVAYWVIDDGALASPDDFVDAAIRKGRSSDTVSSYLERMGFDVASYDPLVEEIHVPGVVPADEAREIRLKYAERLEEDVERASALYAD